MLEEPSKLTVRSNMKMNFQASQTATNSTPTRRQKAALGRNGSLTCNKYDSIPKEHNGIQHALVVQVGQLAASFANSPKNHCQAT